MLRSRTRKENGAALLAPLFVSLLFGPAVAQQQTSDPYLLGEEQRLEFVVHVLGEVERPGEYRVPDDTDVLEAISKAGGPTEFAHLGNVSLRRRDPGASGVAVSNVDLSSFLKHESDAPPPILGPGDVITVPRNKMARWRTAFTLVRDVSVVATAYLLYLRIDEN